MTYSANTQTKNKQTNKHRYDSWFYLKANKSSSGMMDPAHGVVNWTDADPSIFPSGLRYMYITPSHTHTHTHTHTHKHITIPVTPTTATTATTTHHPRTNAHTYHCKHHNSTTSTTTTITTYVSHRDTVIPCDTTLTDYRHHFLRLAAGMSRRGGLLLPTTARGLQPTCTFNRSFRHTVAFQIIFRKIIVP
jgi:hypothetical protein